MGHDEPSPEATLCGAASLQPLTEAQRRRLAEIARHQLLVADDVVYEEGAEGNDFLLVETGELEARRNTPMGLQRVATLGPGDLVGEISMLDGGLRSSSVVAVHESHAWSFTNLDVARLVCDEPQLEVAMLRMFCRSLAGKIRQANTVMTQIMAPDADEVSGGAGARGQRQLMDLETKRTILDQYGLGSTDLQELAEYVEAQHFPSGDPILHEGQRDDTLYIIANGQVRISRRFPGMGEEALAILDRGEVFGEMAWIDARPRSADAISHTGGCTVLAISRGQLDGSIEANPDATSRFLKLICQILCRRIRAMNEQLVAYRTMAWFE